MNVQNNNIQKIMFGSQAGKKLAEFGRTNDVKEIIENERLGTREKEEFVGRYTDEIDTFVRTAKDSKIDQEDNKASLKAITDTDKIIQFSQCPECKQELSLSDNVLNKSLKNREKLSNYIRVFNTYNDESIKLRRNKL